MPQRPIASKFSTAITQRERSCGDPQLWTVRVRFGRPQGIAFSPNGEPDVVDALAGASGVYRIARDGSKELVLAGPSLIGLAFDSVGTMVGCSNETAFRLE